MKKLGSFKYVILILLSAFIYSFNIPFLNMFGSNIPPFLKNTCLYFGAAISMLLIIIFQKFKGGTSSGFNKKNLLAKKRGRGCRGAFGVGCCWRQAMEREDAEPRNTRFLLCKKPPKS